MCDKQGNCFSLLYLFLFFARIQFFFFFKKNCLHLFQNILHDWSDDDCVKILQRCKEAIPARKDGGKVEAIQDMLMFLNGKERDEQEWKMIFSAAGFSNDYKILPVLGPLSIIEIYPCNQCQRQLPGSPSATSTTDYRHRL